MSLWCGYFYTEYGSLLWALVVIFISTSEMAILHTYHLLKKENYRWWWRSFFTGGSSAIWASGWMLFLLQMQLELNGATTGMRGQEGRDPGHQLEGNFQIGFPAEESSEN
jgi:transmembrane 9 superfamily protein 2/4